MIFILYCTIPATVYHYYTVLKVFYDTMQHSTLEPNEHKHYPPNTINIAHIAHSLQDKNYSPISHSRTI